MASDYEQQGDTLTAYGASNYQWYLNDTVIPGATSSQYIAIIPGSYTLQISDSNGCTATSSPQIISGINEIANSHISVYPNPSNGSWLLAVDESLIGTKAEVFDAEGRLVYKFEILNLKSEIDFNAASRVYVLRINSMGNSLVRKLVKM